MHATQRASDVVIIGGGVIGCTTAYRAAQAGLRVTVVERGACGSESSWAGAGILLPGSHARMDPLALIRRASVARYPAFAAELLERTGIDPQYLPCGGLDLITDSNQDAAADREVAAADGRQTPAGEPVVERLTPRQTGILEPAVTSEIRGALLRRDVAQVRNPRLMRALRVACLQAGVRVLTHTEVIDLAVEGSRVVGVRTPEGRLPAGQVVLAAGAWSSRVDRRLEGQLTVYPVRGQIVLLEKLPRPFERVIEHGSHYLVCRADGRILVGATEEHTAGYDKRNTAAGVARLLGIAERFVPALREATLVRAWAGLRPGTPDRRPYIGPVPGLDGLWAATGHFRSGLILAPITAELVVQLLTCGKTEADIRPFAPGRAV